jgi:hypothetical protein
MVNSDGSRGLSALDGPDFLSGIHGSRLLRRTSASSWRQQRCVDALNRVAEQLRFRRLPRRGCVISLVSGEGRRPRPIGCLIDQEERDADRFRAQHPVQTGENTDSLVPFSLDKNVTSTCYKAHARRKFFELANVASQLKRPGTPSHLTDLGSAFEAFATANQ